MLLSLSYIGWTGYENKQDQLNFAQEQKQLEQKIQSATFVIDNPLNTIELTLNKELPKSFHVIAGSFQFVENAHKKVSQLNNRIISKFSKFLWEGFLHSSVLLKGLNSSFFSLLTLLLGA